MLHQLSYTGANPVFDWEGLRFEIQVFTTENRFELDLERLTIETDESSLKAECQGLTWAGGQERAGGCVSLNAKREADGTLLFKLKARHEEESVRSVKLCMRGIARGAVANLRGEHGGREVGIPGGGLILKYPDGFFELPTPLLALRHSPEAFSYFRSSGGQVRPVTFGLFPTDIPHIASSEASGILPDGVVATGDLNVELIVEQDARYFAPEFDAPAWEIGQATSLEDILRRQSSLIEKQYGLIPWEERQDVPRWARDISLVASIHCQHWTGRIFNDYRQVIRRLEWLAARLDPRRILAFLPGWEGRYYYQYGNMRPDPRMGGEAGFEELVREAHAMGVKVMPMFMINGANPRTEGYDTWGAPAATRSASGFPRVNGSCDWDGSRHYDHGCGRLLNPGAPVWQDRLAGQIEALIDRYGFDGVFLDLAAVYVNDPRYSTHEGALQLVERLKRERPELLIAGEGWYDALTPAFPLNQPGLLVSEEGRPLWHDTPYAPLYDKYNRAFGHLGQGDPGHSSTGVFEWGTNARDWRVPVRKGLLPTLTIVEDTLELAPDKAEAILEDARTYAVRYLSR